MCTNIDAIPLPGHNYYSVLLLLQKQIVYHTMILSRAHHITTPIRKLHRHVVDVLTIYPYHSVTSIDTWYLVYNMMPVLYLVSPGSLASVYHLFIVLSFRHRFIVFVTDIPR